VVQKGLSNAGRCPSLAKEIYTRGVIEHVIARGPLSPGTRALGIHRSSRLYLSLLRRCCSFTVADVCPQPRFSNAAVPREKLPHADTHHDPSHRGGRIRRRSTIRRHRCVHDTFRPTSRIRSRTVEEPHKICFCCARRPHQGSCRQHDGREIPRHHVSQRPTATKIRSISGVRHMWRISEGTRPAHAFPQSRTSSCAT
jgi:hypothetical protein